jgi:UDP-2-acetamido-3-amino-2,3-dideoxy-glucuronate N-acetyltransferase
MNQGEKTEGNGVAIHPSAIIYRIAKIGSGTEIEPFAIVGIRDRFHDEAPCVIGGHSFIGSRVTIYEGVVTGERFDASDQSTVFYDNQFGDRCRIGPKAVVKNGCRFGNDVRLASQVFLEHTVVGSNVFVGPGTVFTDDYHPACPKHSECVPKTRVESWVSIGANVTIAPGVTIGHHSQIYAGAVVISDVPPFSVVAGNPASVVKDFRDLECRSGLFARPFEWWGSEKVD